MVANRYSVLVSGYALGEWLVLDSHCTWVGAHWKAMCTRTPLIYTKVVKE